MLPKSYLIIKTNPMKKIKKLISSVVLITMLITPIITTVAIPEKARADGPVLISVVPSAETVAPGESFTVDIVVDPRDISNIVGIQTNFEFDPLLVQVDNVIFSEDVINLLDLFWSDSCDGFGFLCDPGIDNDFGFIGSWITASTKTETTFPSTTFTLLTIDLTAKTSVSGTSYLRLPDLDYGTSYNDLIFTDPDGNPLPYIVTNTSITVAVPDETPPIITLLGDNPVNSYIGDSYEDAGATAFDDVDGDITANIATTGLPINTSAVGTYTITYNVSDSAGNPAEEVSRNVNVSELPEDTTPPVLAEVTPIPTPTNDNTPSYTFSSDEAGAIAYTGGCVSDTTEAIASDNTITFNALDDGLYDNCAITVIDANNNESDSLIISAFIVDTGAPTGTITINDGAAYTNNRDVVLTLSATDDLSEVTEMRVANGSSYQGWEPYAVSKNWTLSEGDGSKTVRVKFKDQAGDETSPGIPAYITLDVAPPTGSISNASGSLTNDATPTLNLTISDSGVGIENAQARLSCDNSAWTDWESYAASKEDFNIREGAGCEDADGNKIVYVQFKDSLKNAGDSYNTGSFVLDTVSSFAILSNTPSKLTNQNSVDITISGTDVVYY